MTDDDFTAALDAILGGVPGDVALTRLAHLVRALVECGGAPAADLLRAVVQVRRRADAGEDLGSALSAQMSEDAP